MSHKDRGWGLQHFLCLETLRELKLSLKKRHSRWDVVSVYKDRVEGVKEISPDSSLWYIVTGQEVVGTCWKMKLCLSTEKQNYTHTVRLALEQVTWRGCGISVFGDSLNSTDMIARGATQPHPFCDSWCLFASRAWYLAVVLSSSNYATW